MKQVKNFPYVSGVQDFHQEKWDLMWNISVITEQAFQNAGCVHI